MSETIFLDFAPTANKTVRIEVKNTADQPVELASLCEALTTHGYG